MMSHIKEKFLDTTANIQVQDFRTPEEKMLSKREDTKKSKKRYPITFKTMQEIAWMTRKEMQIAGFDRLDGPYGRHIALILCNKKPHCTLFCYSDGRVTIVKNGMIEEYHAKNNKEFYNLIKRIRDYQKSLAK